MQCCGADTFCAAPAPDIRGPGADSKLAAPGSFGTATLPVWLFLFLAERGVDILGSLTFIIYCAISIHLCRAGSFRSLCVLTRVRWCTLYSTLYSTVKYYRILGGLLFKSLRIFNNDDTDAKRLIVECY